MDIKQLIANPLDQQKGMMNAHQADIQTAMPGIITAWDPLKMTCSVQPVIQGVLFKDAGAEAINLPMLVDCPVIFSRGLGCSMTWPLGLGQECLVIFSNRCIDSWWQLGAFQDGKVVTRPPLEMRMHDLSDGFVIPGPFSQTNIIPNISLTDVQIRSNDGLASISLNPTTHAIHVNTSTTVNVTSTGNTTITAPITQINGDVQVQGKITSSGDMIANGISLDNHVHSGVQSGGSNTGAPH